MGKHHMEFRANQKQIAGNQNLAMFAPADTRNLLAALVPVQMSVTPVSADWISPTVALA